MTEKVTSVTKIEDNSKQWYMSKTLWIAIIGEIAAVADLVQNGSDLRSILVACVPLVMIILRLVTEKKITL